MKERDEAVENKKKVINVIFLLLSVSGALLYSYSTLEQVTLAEMVSYPDNWLALIMYVLIFFAAFKVVQVIVEAVGEFRGK